MLRHSERASDLEAASRRCSVRTPSKSWRAPTTSSSSSRSKIYSRRTPARLLTRIHADEVTRVRASRTSKRERALVSDFVPELLDSRRARYAARSVGRQDGPGGLCGRRPAEVGDDRDVWNGQVPRVDDERQLVALGHELCERRTALFHRPLRHRVGVAI
eukprot:2653730-Prymnesium_polylepis.1